MTTATWKPALGGVQVSAQTAIEALKHPTAGLIITAKGKVIIHLTGYSAGVSVDIVCDDLEELVGLAVTLYYRVHDLLDEQRETDTER